jgi:hypothetical protein
MIAIRYLELQVQAPKCLQSDQCTHRLPLAGLGGMSWS